MHYCVLLVSDVLFYIIECACYYYCMCIIIVYCVAIHAPCLLCLCHSRAPLLDVPYHMDDSDTFF